MVPKGFSVPVAIIAGTLCLLNPSFSAAQGTESPNAGGLTPLRIPQLMVSVGLGTSYDPGSPIDRQPMQTAAVEFLATRNIVVEAELARWAATWDRQSPGFPLRGPAGQTGFSGGRSDRGSTEGWLAGLNLLYRSEPKRVSAFVGGGPLFGHETWHQALRYDGCQAPGFELYCPRPTGYDVDRSVLKFQAVTGADVKVAGPIHAYGSIHFTTMRQAYFRTAAGIRVVARTQSAASRRRARDINAPALAPERQAKLSGADVRVTLFNGARPRGRFMSLTSTEIVVRQKAGEEVRYPLDQVLRVDEVRHTARKAAIIAAVSGFVAGYLLSCGGGDEEDCWPEVGAMFAGIGAGAGGLIGAAWDHSHAAAHVIYAASPSSVRLAPLVSPRGAGVGLAVRF
jgi:hypothetical protein